MLPAEFDIIVEARQGKISKTLASKAAEYARGDRLHNFKRAAAMMQCTPEKACSFFMAKHMVSILDIVDDIEEGRNNSPAMWDEKIGDAVNYLVLLEGLVKERHAAVARTKISV